MCAMASNSPALPDAAFPVMTFNPFSNSIVCSLTNAKFAIFKVCKYVRSLSSSRDAARVTTLRAGVANDRAHRRAPSNVRATVDALTFVRIALDAVGSTLGVRAIKPCVRAEYRRSAPRDATESSNVARKTFRTPRRAPRMSLTRPRARFLS